VGRLHHRKGNGYQAMHTPAVISKPFGPHYFANHLFGRVVVPPPCSGTFAAAGTEPAERLGDRWPAGNVQRGAQIPTLPFIGRISAIYRSFIGRVRPGAPGISTKRQPAGVRGTPWSGCGFSIALIVKRKNEEPGQVLG